jgi:hypothetical protein
MCAFGRAISAASASGAGGRVSRNEQVVGSIPTGGTDYGVDVVAMRDNRPLLIHGAVGDSADFFPTGTGDIEDAGCRRLVPAAAS